MSIGPSIQAWRLARALSVEHLAGKCGMNPTALSAIEADELDPPASTLDSLAAALGIPPAWLFGDPKLLDLLFTTPDGDDQETPPVDAVDPVLERILLAARQERSFYALLTALLQSGDPRLLRAADVSLRSLVKQSQQAAVPWQSRPPGHFEPPSD